MSTPIREIITSGGEIVPFAETGNIIPIGKDRDDHPLDPMWAGIILACSRIWPDETERFADRKALNAMWTYLQDYSANDLGSALDQLVTTEGMKRFPSLAQWRSAASAAKGKRRSAEEQRAREDAGAESERQMAGRNPAIEGINAWMDAEIANCEDNAAVEKFLDRARKLFPSHPELFGGEELPTAETDEERDPDDPPATYQPSPEVVDKAKDYLAHPNAYPRKAP